MKKKIWSVSANLAEMQKCTKFIFSTLAKRDMAKKILLFTTTAKRKHLEDIGGFQLLDLIIPELKSNVIPYKFIG